MLEAQICQFFQYARARYEIKLLRDAGRPKPWTSDEVLRSYRFCNVFREDDRTTQWFKINVRSPMAYDYRVVFATIMFRYINKIETAQKLLDRNVFQNHNMRIFEEVIEEIRPAPFLNAAYMIKTPNGFDKLSGLLRIFQPFLHPDFYLLVTGCTSMQRLVEMLNKYPYVGPFMAYEIACDLQYTSWFHPTDIYSWANPGPGASRGLSRIMFDRPNPTGSLTGQVKQTVMIALLERSKQVQYWPGHWPSWDMRTVEHTLCEFDKYQRAWNGEGKPKQNFEG